MRLTAASSVNETPAPTQVPTPTQVKSVTPSKLQDLSGGPANFRFIAMAVVFVAIACWFTGMSKTPARTVMGSSLESTSTGSIVKVSGKVVDSRPASDSRPLVTLETADGFQVRVYVSDDAQAEPMVLGRSYTVEGTVQGGLLIANIQRGVKANKTLVTTPVDGVEVDAQGWAHVQGLHGDILLPTGGMSPGVYQGTVERSGGVEMFVERQ